MHECLVILTTIAFDNSLCASSSFTAVLAILCERNLCRAVQSAFLQIVLGISLNPKPRRNAPVTSPNVFEQAIAQPNIPLPSSLPVKKIRDFETGNKIPC